MTSTVFVNGVTLSDEDWFNDLNRLHYTIFGDPANIAAVVATFAATQANQETGSSTSVAVTPGVQQYHPSAAKGWAKYDTGTTIAASYNVASITDSGSGSSTVVWATDFSSASYAVASSVEYNSSSSTTTCWALQLNSPAAGTVNIIARDFTGQATDPSSGKYHVAAFGDQA